MTDNEIIKALECCNDPQGRKCKECYYSDDPFCLSSLTKAAFYLVNRQKAEIERFTKEQKNLAEIGKMYSELRAEAIKEFAERLKHMLGIINGFDYDCSTIFYHIDNLVKEMVGDLGV